MRKFILTALLVSGSIMPLPVRAQPEDVLKAAAQESFVQADINKDNNLDAAEFNVFHLVQFETMDRDFDGTLSESECEEYCFSYILGASRDKFTDYHFKSIDRDKNDLIDQDEYIAYVRNQFRYYDRNENKLLDQNEFIAFYLGVDERAYMVNATEGEELKH